MAFLDTIQPETTVYDLVVTCNDTAAVFESYNDQAGECICCESLFLSLAEIAEKYGLDLRRLMADLQKVVGGPVDRQ